MRRKMRRSWRRKTAAIATAILTVAFGGVSHAMPQGEVIRSGDATIQRSDDNKSMEVNQSTKRVAIDWSSFDIANDERVHFKQPDASAVALNRVTGDAKSIIDGQLSSNGRVYVINPNGVLFGQNASVDVGSLVASTAKVSDATMIGFGKSSGDLTLSLDDANTQAAVINEGQIKAEGGLVALHAASVENSGTITSDGGKIALAAAKNISLAADTAGKLNFTVDGALAKASTLNSGVLKSDGGYVVMTAKQAGDVMSTVVNNTGTIEAKTLREDEKGEILLDGGDTGLVEIGGTLDASGMEAGQSAGSIKAIGAETHVEDGATLHAIGAVDGGTIETSGDYLEFGDAVDIDASGKTGKAGEWLLDPLNVVISDTKPSDTAGTASTISDGVYEETQSEDANKVSWVDSATVNSLLSSGTNVKIQSVDANKAATITVDSAIQKTGAADKDTTLTLEAQSNVTVNQSITSTAGKLNVVLNSDTDGNGIGAVILNADIDTNGGNFTAGSGGNVELTDGKVTGTADPTQGTVGTYFGNGGVKGNRTITTNGGAVTFYGDVALGLNGGNLVINPGAGAVTVTGSVDSGNAYKLYTMDDDDWDDLVSEIKTKLGYSDAQWNYQLMQYYNSLVLGNKKLQSGRSDATSYWQLNDADKARLARYYVANNWELAKVLAQGDTDGGAAEGDTYLATITTALENSLVSQGKENPLFVGGKGSGNATSTNPTAADPDHTDGYYWVTGPEGLANDGKGTKFASNDGTPEDNSYEKWNSSTSAITGNTEKEPNNSGPYVSVGFGLASNWDDVSQKAGTTRGFVQETNLAHSGLVINSKGGNVDLQGNAGYSVPLSELTINDAGMVNIGGGTNQSGANLTGVVNTDGDVNLAGTAVKVGDRITSGGKITITSAGDMEVNGIQAADKIRLTSTGKDSVITLASKHNDGSLVSSSTANDAVVIDAQGENGSFVNNTTAESAIKTEGGSWKIYTASPELNTYGENLNSGTNAQWNADSTTYAADTDTDSTGKYIFQVQPTLTVKADDKTKVYGETFDPSQYSASATGTTFTGRDGKTYDVKDAAFQNAFDEGDLNDRYSGTISYSSEGADAAKTRTGGTIEAADGNKAGYTIEATGNLTSRDGYDVKTADGVLQILKRTATITGNGEQTYGKSTLTSWATTQEAENKAKQTGFVNDDKIVWTVTELAIKDGSTYAKNQAGRTTANAGTYADAVAVDYDAIAAANPDVIVNYNLQAVGNLTVNKAKLTVTTEDKMTTYGTVDKGYHSTIDGLTNGDDASIVNLTYGTDGYLSDTKTNHAGDYALTTSADALQNYDVTTNTANLHIDKAKLKVTTENKTTTYGTVDKAYHSTIDGLVNGDDSSIVNLTYATDGYLSDTKTNDAGDYDITTGVNDLQDYDVTTNTANLHIDKAKLKVTTEDKTTTYGTVDKGYHSTIDGLVNGDDASIVNLTYATDGYLSDTKTNDAGDYPLATRVDALKNYDVATNTANLHIDKAPLTIKTGDIYTMYGTVKTATSTVDGLVNGDLPAGFTFDYGDYGGAYVDNNTSTNVPGQYSFRPSYDGPDFLKNYTVTNEDATVTIDMRQRKPDLDAHEPSNTSGTASYTSNLGGRQGVPGVDRVAGLTDAQLPFFRVEAGKVTQYGTYDVTETPSEVRLQPTGKRLPEPNQPKTQYREYTKTLTTADGGGQFLMTYDGSTFRIEPTDGAALALVHAGDTAHNVDLSAKALHVGFSEMGLVLESLDAVYVCLDGHSQTGSDELA